MVAAIMLLFAISDAPEAQVERNARVIAAVQGVHELSKSGVADHRRIGELLKRVEEADELRRVALATFAMIDGRAEYERLDNVYWAAFWVAVRKLASGTGEESVTQLSIVAERTQLGGGELMTMNELRAAQEKRRRAFRKH